MALKNFTSSTSRSILSPKSQPLESISNSPLCSPSLTHSPSFVKDLQDWVSATIKQATEKFQETVSEIQIKYDQLLKKYQELEQKHESFSAKVTTACEGLAGYVDELAEIIDRNEQAVGAYDHRLKFIEQNLENLKQDVTRIQFRNMQYAIRIRGLAEDPKEDIKRVIANAFMNVSYGPEIYFELESVFRVNSWFAYQKKFPRDIMVYFTTKLRRNEIMQLFYQQRFKILNQDIIFLKEIPAEMLKERRNYAFLTHELKKRQIAYRWGIPTGIKTSVNGIFYGINSVKEANDFMVSVLQVDCPPASHNIDSAEQPASSIMVQEEMSGLGSKEQGSRKKSRAARRRKQKEHLIASPADTRTSDCLSVGTLPPVGGA